MCGSMVHIQSPTAENRRGKKKKESKKRKIETTAAKYNGLPIRPTMGAHNNDPDRIFCENQFFGSFWLVFFTVS